MLDSEQQLSTKLLFKNGHQMVSTLVYAKYAVVERLLLWEDIYYIF